MAGDPRALLRSFCIAQRVAANSVSLFKIEPSGKVAVRLTGIQKNRPLLQGSSQMESAVIREVGKLRIDWNAGTHLYDGLIYVMFWLDRGQEVVPLYIGKAETAGRNDGVFSANLNNLERDRGKFARWGDGHAYHIGDLSACVLPGHKREKATVKYRSWAARLFEEVPAEAPCLGRDVRLWVKAWPCEAIGIWPEFGPTRLSFLEYLMIGVASAAFPDTLLNREGHNRTPHRPLESDLSQVNSLHST